MKTPDFWYRPTSPLARLLTPIGWLYSAAGSIRRAATRPRQVSVPVICVGNLVAGGAGKTPVALAIARLLKDRRPMFLTRGYGGSLRGPVQVNLDEHDATQVGDEARLLAAAAPTWLSHDRPAGAKAAIASGAGVIVMDDGFQNPTLKKDVTLLVIDGATGFGNGKLLPAGPLREPPAQGIRRANGIVLVGNDQTRLAGRLPATLPIFTARLVPTPKAQTLSGERVVAFAGIGRPQKFFDTLKELDCDIVAAQSFADHQPYNDAEIGELVSMAATNNAVLVTTAKDAARLSPDQRAMVRVVDVEIAWNAEPAIRRFLLGLSAAGKA